MGVLLDVVVAPRRLQSSSSNKLCGFASIRSAFLTRRRPLALASARASGSCDGGPLRSETSSFPHVCAWKHVLFLDVRAPRSSAAKRLAPLRLRRPHKASIFGLCGMPFSEVESKKSETFWFGIFRKVSDAFGAVSDRFRAFRTLSERFGPFQNVSDSFRVFWTVSERFGPFANSPGLIAFRAYFHAATSRRRRLPAGLGVPGLAISGNFHRRPKRNFRLRRGSQATPSLDAETCPASPSVFAGLWLSDAGMATAATRAPEHMRTRAAAAKHATARSRNLGRAVALRVSKGRKPLSVGGENGSKRTGTFYFRGGQT